MMGCQWPLEMVAPNVEPAGMQIIGGLPIQGDELLASMSVDLEPSAGRSIPSDQPQQTLPSLGAPR